MIYLYAALYPEAKPLIRYFGLKRKQMGFGFDVYEGERLRLILTGAGAPAAAAAVGSTLAFFRAGEHDFLVNWGSCASDADVGTVFRCHKIIDRMFQYTFYPDMIFSSDLREAAVVTEPGVWIQNNEDKKSSDHAEEPFDMPTQRFEYAKEQFGMMKQQLEHVKERFDITKQQLEDTKYQSGMEHSEIVLHDMEAAAIYFTGSYFLSPHQMHFIKMVSDHGADYDGKSADEKARFLKEYEELLQENLPKLLSYLDVLLSYEETRMETGFMENEHSGAACSFYKEGKILYFQEELENIYQEFCCSQTMKHSVLQCVKYWSLMQIDYEKELQGMRAVGELPCRDRREGKKKWEELKEKLL